MSSTNEKRIDKTRTADVNIWTVSGVALEPEFRIGLRALFSVVFRYYYFFSLVLNRLRRLNVRFVNVGLSDVPMLFEWIST